MFQKRIPSFGGGRYPGSSELSWCWVNCWGSWTFDSGQWTRKWRRSWGCCGEVSAHDQCFEERPTDGGFLNLLAPEFYI
jgi:hypothetical protein